MTAIAPLTLNIIVPAVPNLAVVLDASVDTVQLTVSLYLLVLAFSQLALGPLSDRFGRRPVIIAGLALTALMSAAALLASSITRPYRRAQPAGARRFRGPCGRTRHHPGPCIIATAPPP